MLEKKKYNIIGGIISPVHDKYGKSSLIEQGHRVNMVNSAIESYDWISCSDWETAQDKWTRTSFVLNHISDSICKLVPDTKILLCMGSDV